MPSAVTGSVLQLGAAYPPYAFGGASRLSALLRQGPLSNLVPIHVVTHVAGEGGELGSQWDEEHGVMVHRVQGLPKALWVTAKLVRSARVEVIHTHNPRIGLLALLLWPRKQHLVEIHSSLPDSPWKALLSRWVLARADAVVFNSAVARTAALKRLNLAGHEWHVLQNGAPGDDFLAIQKDPPFLGTSITVGYFGSFHPWQGVVHLAKAISQIAAEVPEAEFLLIGTGPAEAEVRRILQGRLEPERVTFTGAVDRSRLIELIRQMDIMVIPRPSASNTEVAVPLKLLESMAAGRAIVATRVEGLMELLRPGENCVAVTPGDVAELAEALKDLVRDPQRGRRLAAQAAADVELLPTWPEMSTRWADLYRNLLGVP